MPSEPLRLSKYQKQVLGIPEEIDGALPGGRGGSKSHTLVILTARHAEQYGPKARAIYLRQSFPGVRDFEQLTLEVYGQIYGTAARYNASDKIWRFPGGGTLELNQLENPQQLTKFQGRSLTLLLADEAGEWASPELLDRMRSNLRSGGDVPVRMILAANPGGPGHAWIHRRHVAGVTPWQPYTEKETGARFVTAPSTYLDNPFIDQDEYRRQLEAATATDPELRRAWIEGDWNIARGAFFGAVLGEKNAFDPWPLPEDSNWWRSAEYYGWEFSLAHDYGSAAPSVTFVTAESPGAKGPDDRFYPRGSILLLDELATNRPDSLSDGMGYTVPRLSDEIKQLAERWGVSPEGVADDAIFSQHGSAAGSIAQEFARCGVSWSPAHKGDRLSGWERLKTMMQAAGEPDKAGFYVSRSCRYFWQTVPFLGRDPRRVEDVDTRAADHAADAARYAVIGTGRGMTRLSTVELIGL